MRSPSKKRERHGFPCVQDLLARLETTDRLEDCRANHCSTTSVLVVPGMRGGVDAKHAKRLSHPGPPVQQRLPSTLLQTLITSQYSHTVRRLTTSDHGDLQPACKDVT